MHLRRFESLPYTSYEHGHVGPLPAAIGMELVEHEETQSLATSDQRFFLRASQHKLQHHIVGKEDVRWIGDNLLLFFVAFLTGIAGKGNRAFFVGKAEVDELMKLVALAVSQSIHRVDDNSLDPPA